ncbi:MAG: hypothetical protein JWM71_958 [Solirubrobacteraceae bacterium]|nr:hypothetical protein [Solirubrobacteraceae bacterium]
MLAPGAISVHSTALSDRAVRVAVEGELDLATAPHLEEELAWAMGEGYDVVLDLAGLTFMDSTGINVLMGATNQAQLDGWNLSIGPDLPEHVRQLFRITGVDDVLPLAEE